MKIIRQYIAISVVVFLAATGISLGQTFTNTPNDTIQLMGMMEDLQTLSIQQVNVSQDTVQLKWQKVSAIVPADWEAAVCDNSICYTSLVNNGSMIPVAPTDFGFILLHVTPHVNLGTATIRYAVWDEANPALKDTLTLILTVDGTSSVQEGTDKPQINIFPNPTSDNITITNLTLGSQYIIYDSNGKNVISGNNSAGILSIPCKTLPNGAYTISITNKGTTAITKKFIIQL